MQNDPHYTAPEILKFEEPSKSSDVYSFSMIVYEILTKDKPFSHLKTANEVFNEVVHKQGRPKFPSNNEIPIFYREIIEFCWQQDPYERPTFDDIVYRLKFDQRFFNGLVRKEEFDQYVEYIESNKEINNEQHKIEETDDSCQYKINETDEKDQKHATESVSDNNLIVQTSSSTSNPENKEKQTESHNFETSDNNEIVLSAHQFESSNQNSKPLNNISEIEQNGISSDQIITQKPVQQNQYKPIINNKIDEKETSKLMNSSISQSLSKEETKQSKSKLQQNTAEIPSSSTSSSDLLTAYNEIRDDNCSTKWALALFNDKNKDWVFYGKGEGEYDEMISSIGQNFIGFCYFRANRMSRGIILPVFVIVKYSPNNVKMITKAQMNAKRGYIENIFKYSNISIEATSLSELSLEISKKLK